MALDVLILMGSKNDQPVAGKVVKVLQDFGISHALHVASAHRAPAHLHQLVDDANARVHIVIGGVSSGMSGVVASLTTRPVIGVPVSGKVPYDSLLSMVQAPRGVPVATVGVDRGDNAGFLAAQILAVHDGSLAKKLAAEREDAAQQVINDDRSIQE